MGAGMTSYHPATIDGAKIEPDAPRAQGMLDATAEFIQQKSEEYRSDVLHFTTDLVDRTLTVTASNAPEGLVAFNFGDHTGEISEQITGPGESATAEHTYAADGTFDVSIRAGNDRYSETIAVNWPDPFPIPPEPLP